jgi:hypothetical protein
LQAILQQEFGLKLSTSSQHFENETLYWTKAASILGLEQLPLPFSEVPIPAGRAETSLRAFLKENGIDPGTPLTQERLNEAFASLCRANAPVFLEKSPHHLYERAALGLMRVFAQSQTDIRVKFIGLVRNPIDTVYSAWRRFGILPWVEEACWVEAYSNLIDLQQQMPEAVRIVRYRDLVAGSADMEDLATYLGLPIREAHKPLSFDTKSLGKWRSDPSFGYVLSPAARALAITLGYSEAELEMPNRDWPWSNNLRHLAFSAYHAMPQSLRQRAVSLVRTFKKR